MIAMKVTVMLISCESTCRYLDANHGQGIMMFWRWRRDAAGLG